MNVLEDVKIGIDKRERERAGGDGGGEEGCYRREVTHEQRRDNKED